MLAAGDPVSRVAGRVGYDTPSAFVAAFRRETGRPRARSSEPEAGVARGERQRVRGQLGHPAHRPGAVSHLVLGAQQHGPAAGPDEVACCSAAHILYACTGSTRVSLVNTVNSTAG